MMDTNIITQSVSNPYWAMLKGLSDDVKIDLSHCLESLLLTNLWQERKDIGQTGSLERGKTIVLLKK